jgi:hypothetical protein
MQTTWVRLNPNTHCRYTWRGKEIPVPAIDVIDRPMLWNDRAALLSHGLSLSVNFHFPPSRTAAIKLNPLTVPVLLSSGGTKPLESEAASTPRIVSYCSYALSARWRDRRRTANQENFPSVCKRSSPTVGLVLERERFFFFFKTCAYTHICAYTHTLAALIRTTHRRNRNCDSLALN